MGPTEQLASRRARSSSVCENALISGDDTANTPIGAPSETSGSTTIDPMAKPWLCSGVNRASLCASTTRAGSPCSSTQPEMPDPARSGTEGASCPMPERALASRCVRDASSRRIDAWSPGRMAIAASVTARSASSSGRPSVRCSVSWSKTSRSLSASKDMGSGEAAGGGSTTMMAQSAPPLRRPSVGASLGYPHEPGSAEGAHREAPGHPDRRRGRDRSRRQGRDAQGRGARVRGARARARRDRQAHQAAQRPRRGRGRRRGGLRGLARRVAGRRLPRGPRGEARAAPRGHRDPADRGHPRRGAPRGAAGAARALLVGRRAGARAPHEGGLRPSRQRAAGGGRARGRLARGAGGPLRGPRGARGPGRARAVLAIKEGMRTRALCVACAALVGALVARDARAVGTRTFELDTLDRLSGGDLKGVSVGSDGVVRAGWTLGDVPLPEGSGTTATCSLVLADGSVLVGTGPSSGGKVVRVAADRATVFADTHESAVNALAVDRAGTVFAATTSNKIYRVSQGKADVF